MEYFYCTCRKRFLLVACVAIATLVIWAIKYRRDAEVFPVSIESLPRDLFVNDNFIRTLLLLNRSTPYCEELTDQWSLYNMSAEYYRRLPEFEAKLKEATNGMKDSEGYSSQVPEEMRILHLLAGLTSVKTVCETGFNYGHSSFNYLTANSQLKVHSFDIGSHVYSKRMAKVLLEMFGGYRLTVHFGDSQVEVPKVKASGTLPWCDLIFVDGGHTYSIAKADLYNFGNHSSKEHLVIFDDYPTDWGVKFGKAWEERLVNPGQILDQQKNIVELLKCKKKHTPDNFQRGFVIGKYLSGVFL